MLTSIFYMTIDLLGILAIEFERKEMFAHETGIGSSPEHRIVSSFRTKNFMILIDRLQIEEWD